MLKYPRTKTTSGDHRKFDGALLGHRQSEGDLRGRFGGWRCARRLRFESIDAETTTIVPTGRAVVSPRVVLTGTAIQGPMVGSTVTAYAST